MENYNFSALSISIQTDAPSSQSGKQFSSPLKSDKTNLLDLDTQKQINASAQQSQVDFSIQKDCEEEVEQQTSEQKSNSLCESQLKQTKPSQNKKKLVKRCQTTLLIGQSIHKHNSQKAEKYFIKKNNQIIEKSFEKIKGKRSNFSRMFLTNIRQLQKPIQVRYFRSTITKVLVIDQDMLAAEFIVLALTQFQNDVKLDQSLYEFPNYSLAYQIEGQDDQQDLDEFQYRRQPQRYKSFGSLEDKMKSRRESLNEIDYDQKPVSQFEISFADDNDDKIIQIDLESPMRYYKSVDIVPILDSKQLDIDLQMAKIVYQQHPNHILILIEEPISKGRFHIKIQANQLIEELFVELSMKANKKYRTADYNLILKYPCIHMSTEPINLKIPISKLPIHYLILTQKFQNEANRSLRQFADSYTINVNKETIFSRSVNNKSYRFLQEEGKSNEYTDKVRNLYSYQEFQLLKIDNQYRNNVILGIDYFDLYYSYTQERQRKFTLGKFCKSISQYLIEEPIAQKDYRRLPLNKIQNVELAKDFQLIIVYEKSQNYKKQIHLGIDLNQEKSKIDLQQKTIMNAYNKLEYLVDLYIKYKQQL